jgi:hypothetical protein
VNRIPSAMRGPSRGCLMTCLSQTPRPSYARSMIQRVFPIVARVWRTGASPSFGARGYTLLATTDVDHDGHLELISYQNWANDYGLDVFGDADPQPLYSFSCGNIRSRPRQHPVLVRLAPRVRPRQCYR